MGSIDILQSISMLFSSAAVPSTLKELIYGALGNSRTCSAQSFFFIIGTSVPLYNSMLCLYYLAVIRYEVNDRVLIKYEKYMHMVAVLLPLAMAVFGAATNVLHPLPNSVYCWVGDGCEFSVLDATSDCVRRPAIFIDTMYIFGMVIALFTLISIVGSMGLIYWTVHMQAVKMRRYHSFSRGNSVRRASQIATTRPTRGTDEDETLIQSSLYSFAYFLTFVWSFVLAILDMTGSRPSFALLFLEALFYPLQGKVTIPVESECT